VDEIESPAHVAIRGWTKWLEMRGLARERKAGAREPRGPGFRLSAPATRITAAVMVDAEHGLAGLLDCRGRVFALGPVSHCIIFRPLRIARASRGCAGGGREFESLAVLHA